MDGTRGRKVLATKSLAASKLRIIKFAASSSRERASKERRLKVPVYRRKDTNSKRFYFKFQIDGVTYKKNVPTARTRRQAEDAEREARQEVHDGRYSSQRSMLFTDFVKEHYLPWAAKHHAVNDTDETNTDLLCSHFKSHTLAQVSTMAVEGFKLKLAKEMTRYKRPFAPGSVNLALGHLSVILNMAVRYNLKKENTCKGVARLPIPPKRPRYLLAEEEELLMPTLKPWVRDLVQFAIWTGFRQAEIIAVQRSHVDFERGVIFVQSPKWKKDPRKTEGFPMGQHVRELVQRLVQRLCGDEFLFNQNGEPLTKPMVHHAFRSACHKVGIRDLNFHALRHTFGTRLGDQDVNLKKIARLMGHANTKHTEIYVHTTDAGLFEAVEIATVPAQNRTSRGMLKVASSL